MSGRKLALYAIGASYLFFAGLPPASADSSHQKGPPTWITNKWRGWPIHVDEPRGCAYNLEDPNCVLRSPIRLSRSNYDSFFVDGRLIKWYDVKGRYCLDVEGGRTDRGAPVILWGCHGGPNQQWQIESYYKGPNEGITILVNVGSGKCLDVRNPAAGNAAILPPDGAALQIWDCFPGKSYVHWRINQSWELKF